VTPGNSLQRTGKNNDMDQAHAFYMDSCDEQSSESRKGSEPFSLLPLGDELEGSEAEGGSEPSHVDEILREAVSRGSSDIHLSVGLPPVIRIDGRLVRTEYAALNGQQIQRMVYDILSKDQILWLEKSHELDFSYGLSQVGRFRVNAARWGQRSAPCQVRSRASRSCGCRMWPRT